MSFIRFRLPFLSVLLSGVACAAAPDLTASLEFVDNPATNRWPANSYARGCLDLQFYRGRLFNGGGEVETNPGPTWIHSIDPWTNETRFEYSAGTEAIANYLVTSWGDLLSPSQDPHEGDATAGHGYRRDADGAWSVFKSVGGSLPAGSSTVANSTHCWHMTEFDGRVFMASYNLLSSTDRCQTFQVCSPITNAYHNIRRAFSVSTWGKKKTYSYGTTSTLRRQVHFFRFENELFALGNTIVNPSLWSDRNVNNQELYRYDTTTKRFVETSQHLSTIYPSLTPADYRLVGRNYAYLTTNECAYAWMRPWHPTPFKGRVLYVASYDTPPYSSKVAPFEDSIALTSYPLPLMGCSATVSSGKIAATRLSFGGDAENYPWDYAVCGDAVYALTSKYDATTKLNRHVVWKSTDGVSFAEVLSFDFHQNMISLEYRDGWFYFGAGVKSATKGYAYDKQADEAGAIYRIRCPQEPVAVVAAATGTLSEGTSKAFGFRLSAAPATNLTLRVAARASQQVTLDRTSLVFTPENWSVEQTVTATYAEDSVCDGGTIHLRCGAATDDVERGAFSSPEVTSAVIAVTALDNETGAVISDESFAATTNALTYTVACSAFGSLGPSLGVALSVYSDAAMTCLAGRATGTVTDLGTPVSVTVTGLDRGVWYWARAERTSGPGDLAQTDCKYLSPIAADAELVDLMDDLANRASVTDTATSYHGACDNDLTSSGGQFGGYSLSSLIYAFKEKRVVNGLGICAAASGDTDRMANTFTVYASDSYDDITNKTPSTVVFKRSGEKDWAYGEWRRWVVTNTTAYTYYRVSCSSSVTWNMVSEIELYGLGSGSVGPSPDPDPDPDPLDPDPDPLDPDALVDLTQPESANPNMTNCSGSSSWLSPANAFDNDQAKPSNGGRWGLQSPSERNPAWVAYTFETNTVVNAYAIHNQHAGGWDSTIRAPKAFTFSGSNDGTSWTVLDTRTDETAWSGGERRVYTFANAVAYRTYRLSITEKVSSESSQYVCVQELEMFYVPPRPGSVTVSAAETQADAVTVPYAWLREKGLDCSTPEKALASATAVGANGCVVWASYVADLDPTDPDSRFTATISVGPDGTASVSWSPDSPARTYRVLGKTNLTDAAWSEKTADHRFFKVEVGL